MARALVCRVLGHRWRPALAVVPASKWCRRCWAVVADDRPLPDQLGVTRG